jgi:hypothetical protein
MGIGPHLSDQAASDISKLWGGDAVHPLPEAYDALTNWLMTSIWLILEQLWALFPAAKIQAHLVPFSKGQMANPSPRGASFKKLQFQGKLFTATFLQAAVAGPILGIDFLRKFKVIVSPELSQIQFACSAAAPSAHD